MNREVPARRGAKASVTARLRRRRTTSDENWTVYVVGVCLGLLAMMLVGQLPVGR